MVADFDAALNDPVAQKAFAARLEAWEAANYHQDVSNEGLAEGVGKAGDRTRPAGSGWTFPSSGRRPAWRSTARCGSGGPSRSPPSGPGRTCASPSARSTTSTPPTSPARRSAAPARRRPATTPCRAATPCPAASCEPGRTVIAVRVFDHYGGGGFSGAAPEMAIGPATGAGASLSLAGPWEYRVERELAPSAPDFATQPRYPSADNPNSPTVLYGAMIAPLTPLAIRGAIWYQGESNAGAAFQYRTLFPAMIRDWRRAWGRGDFPFLFVQLANYMARAAAPGESAWAELREAQARTLAVPHTGMAVAIDIGEAGDIHPKNKKDVGSTPRALGARRHVRPGGREVRPPLRLLRPRGRRRARALPPRGRAEGGRRGREGLCGRRGRSPVALGRGTHRRRDGRRLLARRAATRGRPLRLGRQPGGDAAQRRGPAGLALPHRRLADAHRPARRRRLPQPRDPGVPPRPERRARGGRLLPGHEQLRVLPRRADLHEPRPGALATAGPRPDAREPAAPAEGPPVGRHLRSDPPAPRTARST